MKKVYIMTPTYNDLKSLNKLLQIINKNFRNLNIKTSILIVNDGSDEKFSLNIKKFKYLNNIHILNLERNVGSQKAIFTGLKFLNKKLKKESPNIVFSVLDSDGEDNPNKIKDLINLAFEKNDTFIFASRLERTENIFFKIINNLRLYITFIFTGHYINFGNFSAFSFKILKKIISNDNLYFAFSSGVLKNYRKIFLFPVKKNKRFFGKSKVNLRFLVNHSINILSIFYLKVFFRSILIFIPLLIIFNNAISIFILSLTFLILNLTLFFYKKFGNPKINVLLNIRSLNSLKGRLI